MTRFLRRLAVAAFACASLTCGPHAGERPAEPKTSSAAAERVSDYPALRWVPADATYAVVTSRLGDASAAVGELVRFAGLIEGMIDPSDAPSFGETAAVEEPDVFSWLGGVVQREGDLAAAGFDVDRSAALFSRGLFPTVVAPVADPEALARELERRRPPLGLSVRRMGGHDVFTYAAEDDVAIAWVRFDDWFALHVYDPRRDPEEGAWFGRLLASAERPPGVGLAGDETFGAALARVRELLPPDERLSDPLVTSGRRDSHPEVVGLVHPARLVAGVPDAGRDLVFGCVSRLGTGPLALAADMGNREGRGVLVRALDPGDARALEAALAPEPPAGYRRFRDGSAIHVELAFDIGAAGKALSDRCPPIPALQRTGRRVGAGSIRGYAVAGLELSPSQRTGKIGVHLALADRSFIDALLDEIPMRGALERTRRIAGVDVKTIDAPVVPPIRYRLTDRDLVGAVGKGVIQQLLGPAPEEPAPGKTILRAGIHPGRLPELREILSMVVSGLGVLDRGRVERTAGALYRYRSGMIRLSLDGDDLVLRAGMRAR